MNSLVSTAKGFCPAGRPSQTLGRGGWGWQLAAIGLLFSIACSTDQPSGPGAGRPSLAISDGAHEGNDHFFFLPPLVKQPVFSGTFDPTLDAVVTVCEWSRGVCVGQPLATFSRTTGTGSEILRVEPGEEIYVVNLHTNQVALDPAKLYRISVTVGSAVLGYADVDPVNSGKELRNVNTGEYIPLVNGSTLSIKFRVEDGALPDGGNPLAAGGAHTCFLTTAGDAYCSGFNYYGQLGIGTAGDQGGVYSSEGPVPVAGGHKFVEIGTGESHSCARKADGSVWCWGYNGVGSLGRGTFTYIEPVPAPVMTGGVRYTRLFTNGYHNCGLDAAGIAYCWGYNGQGQLGNGTQVHSATPASLRGYAFSEIAPGIYHTCGVTTSGAGYCWGFGREGQRGDGTSVPVIPEPVPVGFRGALAGISSGIDHSCALDSSGDVHCWGVNWDGRLGLGATSDPQTLPQPVAAGGLTFQSVDLGHAFSCAVTSSGIGYCWGNNTYGQLGTGFVGGYSVVPVSIARGLRWSHISAGGTHACGITITGEGLCWGEGRLGQLGSGVYAGAAAPIPIVGSYSFPVP